MTTLISIAHDPAGALVQPTKKALGLLKEIYSSVIVNVTDTSDVHLIAALAANCILSPVQGVGAARRLALKYALGLGGQHFHYCDFDRLLYWALHHPDELADVSQGITEFEFTIIGRTEAAFASHPELQRRTEGEGSTQFSLAWGQGVYIDILAGSRGINKAVAGKILESSTEMGAAGIDTEWPFIAGGFWYTECDGLAYESSYLGIEKSPMAEAMLRTGNLIEVLQVLRKRSK
jgi:hypothetical protein